jgi:lysophospholipid acyltransferase (LPLAT)-like uncharacterized protein
MTWWRRVLFAIVAPITAGLIRAIWASYRYQVHGDAKLKELAKSGTPLVLAFWHEEIMVLGWYTAGLFKLGAKVAYLISPSVDGELGVKILGLFGGTSVRGSATRSGVTALRGLYRAIRRDKMSPCITLDGPKGPLRYCKPGAVMIARMAGVPVVPIACAARRSWRAPTWDRHLFPKPLTRVVIMVGEPYTIAGDGGEDDLEEHRSELETRVNSLLQEAEARVHDK